MREFERVEVRALHVLDQGQLESLAVIDIGHHHGNRRKPRETRGPPALLAADELVAVARFAESYTAQKSSARLERPPTLDAYLAYHATNHLLQAINIAGLDRRTLRRTLAKLDGVVLAELKRRRWEPLTLPDR